MKKSITTTREDDDRAIRGIDAIIKVRGMVDGQTQYELLIMAIEHIRNTRKYVDRLREKLEPK